MCFYFPPKDTGFYIFAQLYGLILWNGYLASFVSTILESVCTFLDNNVTVRTVAESSVVQKENPTCKCEGIVGNKSHLQR